jgi:hypothetical protein
MALKDVGKKTDKTSSRADEVATRDSNRTLRDCPTGVPLHLSEGEINFLWWFMMEAGIMVPETRNHLRRAWGLCQRHAWGWLAIECSFREDFLHGPAILYEDILERAQLVFTRRLNSITWQLGLKNREQCLMCDLGYGPESTGSPNQKTLERARDFTNLKSFARKTHQYWGKYICGLCIGQQNGGFICRPHLLSELAHGRLKRIDIDSEKHIFVDYLSGQVKDYSRSFRWEYRNTRTVENEASLITAIGWCSGWTELLRILD